SLSLSEHKRIFEREIKPDNLEGLEPVLRPKMFMLGGQPGAGKSNVREAITKKFPNALTVDPDELRTYHPRYVQLVKEDPDNAAGRVHYDASKWAAELREVAVELKLNIIFDTSLGGNVNTTVSVAKDAAKAGYDVEVHVAAVSIEASRQAVRKRFEEAHETYAQDPEENLPPRNVPMSKQLDSYKKIPEAIEKLAESGFVSRIRVANRAGESLSDISGKFAVKKDGGKTSTRELNKERTRPWTTREIQQFEETNQQIEKKLQARITGEMNPQERRRLNEQLDELKGQRQEVVDRKQKILNGKSSEYESWFETYLEIDLASV
ncbi:MAG: zeta toxin family protein, partial [Acetobacteraceae bacterium]|nr:zeta toxin family protein [Acetobacteraceae bacterium]